ncbi:Flavone 3'-O-methyltransferase 1 [Citrus sinensis]|nr:Flavone 3'-O-methyltransferase 1 [Citrus sinensis]
MANEQRDENFAYACELVTGSVLHMTMKAVIKLGLFEIIAKAGPGAKLSASEIAAQLPATKNKDAPMMLDRILRLLASYGIVQCALDDVYGSHRLYGLNDVCKYFVSNQDGVSLGPVLALIQDKAFLDSWSQLKETIIEGGVPFDRVHGTHAFEYLGLDPRFNEVFSTAMYNHTTLVIQKILEAYKGFEHIKQLVDVGGSLGNTLKAIISKYPHIEGINFDLPHVIQHAPEYPGVKHVGGDMFRNVPNGDAILIKWILHDWSDEHCLKLLKNCHKSIPEGGKVIVVESVLPELPETSTHSKINFLGYAAGRGQWNGNQGGNQGRGGFAGFNGNGFGFGFGGFNGNGFVAGFNGSGRGRGRGIICQICFKPNHSAIECRDRFNRNLMPNPPVQGSFPPQNQGPRAAYMVTSEGVADQGWYLDSGATHHLTNYSSSEMLLVGDGQGEGDITSIGNC